jgi:hypothetical protein
VNARFRNDLDLTVMTMLTIIGRRDQDAGRALRGLAALALCACTPLPRGTTQPALHRSELQGAFARCESAEVIEERPGQYHVLACDQVAIYQCDGAEDPDEALCTRIAAGDPADVLPRDRSRRTKQRRADQLFELGREMDKDGRHLEACDLFAESYALSPSFGSTLNLGDCEKNRGHAGAAWRLYSTAAEIAGYRGDERLAKSARSFAASLAATKLCTLVITLPDPDAAGLTVHVGDRRIVPAATIRTAVEPATITVVVETSSAPPFRQTVHAVAGTTLPITVPVNRARVALPRPTPAAPNPAARPLNTFPPRPIAAGRASCVPESGIAVSRRTRPAPTACHGSRRTRSSRDPAPSLSSALAW